MTPEKEEEIRTKLRAELPDGCYAIGTGPFQMYTGKEGYIDFQITLMKEIENSKPKSNKEYSERMKEQYLNNRKNESKTKN